MFRRLEDFTSSWKEEAGKTLALFEAIPEGARGTAVAEGHRDLARVAWHLVATLLEMPGHMGLTVKGADLMEGYDIKVPPPAMAEICRTYAEASASLLEGMAGWSDADLEREDDLYGETWKRGRTLFALIAHQIHHRGQMTVLLRQAGLKVPDTYGPAKEGWVAYGMEAPSV